MTVPLSGIVEFKNVSDKQMMSMFFALINASIKGTLKNHERHYH